MHMPYCWFCHEAAQIPPLPVSPMLAGLSKEGWHITKNLMIELAIVFVGFLTFEPAIQV